jgi:hypothetical protein
MFNNEKYLILVLGCSLLLAGAAITHLKRSSMIDSTKSAAVDHTYHWIPVGPDTPRGVKLQLINQAAGVATYGNYTGKEHWTHWAPLPTFKK